MQNVLYTNRNWNRRLVRVKTSKLRRVCVVVGVGVLLLLVVFVGN